MPTGSISGDNKSYLIQVNGQLNNAAEYRSLIVAYKNGAAVRLQDLGQVIDGVQNNKVLNLYTDQKVTNQPAILLAVQPQPDANTVKIVDEIVQMLPTLKQQIPQSIEMGIMYDRSQSIRASVDDLKFSLVLSMCLVVLVIFIFLLVLTAYLFVLVPKGFIATEDTGQLMANTKGAQDISFEDMLLHQQKVVDIIRKNPNIAALNSTVGASGPNASTNNGRITIRLKPRSQRRLSADEIIPELTPKLRGIPGIQAFIRSRAAIPIANVTQTVGPLTVNHLTGLPSATISFDTLPGTSLSQATAAIEKAAKDVLPASVTTSFQGSAQVFNQSFNDLGWLLLVSIVVIYLILGILYQDFIHPLTILSGLPSAGFGALLTLVIFQVELNLYSFIGIILLVGIVKKNGIMLVDFAIEKQRKEGRSVFDAIYEACIVRFRPIMITTMAALIGTLPIALGVGSGSESRRPLGIAIVGGLLFSQVLTLYLTPVFYTYMEGWRKQLGQPKMKLSEFLWRPKTKPSTRN